MKFLIVDDKPENRYLLETLLKSKGFEVIPAVNGLDALEKLKSGNYDMIISDILMPEMDGFQLCRECQKDRKLSKIIFVFYTATYTDERDEEFALQLGADLFIRKPMAPDRFLQMITDIISAAAKSRKKHRRVNLKFEAEVFKLYSQRLVKKLEKKMLDLEESELKYREIFNNANDAIFLVRMKANGKTGKILEVNDYACRLLDYSRKELQERNFEELVEAGQKLELLDACIKLDSEARICFNIKFITSGGKALAVEISAHVFVLQDQDVILMQARDIREILKAEERVNAAERNWHLSFDAMDEILIIVDEEMEIIDVNLKGLAVLGQSRNDVINRSFFTLFFDQPDSNELDNLIKGISFNRITDQEYFDPIKKKFYEIKSTPIEGGNQKNNQLIISVSDITEKKQQEADLNAYQSNLKKQVEERTSNLKEKNKELQHYLKLFENREFRIKELRDEVKKLKEELSLYQGI